MGLLLGDLWGSAVAAAQIGISGAHTQALDPPNLYPCSLGFVRGHEPSTFGFVLFGSDFSPGQSEAGEILRQSVGVIGVLAPEPGGMEQLSAGFG